MLISAIGLLVGVVIPPMPGVPWVSLLLPFFLGLAPLIWYHVGYLRQREVLGHSEIDSVYYYGFLVTIGALGCTALRLSLRGIDGNFADVALQFGLGLLATGYAVWARVQLTAASEIVSEADLIEEMRRCVEKARLLGDTIQLGVNQYTGFANKVVEHQEQFGKRVQTIAEDNIKAAAKEFRESVAGLVEEGKLALQALRAVVHDVTFGAEREKLRNSVLGMTDTVTTLTVTLHELRTSASAGANSVGEFAHGLSQVGGAASQAHEALSSLGDKNGMIPKFSRAVEDSRTSLAELNLSAGVTAASLTSLSDSASGSVDPLKNLEQQASSTVTAMQKIGDLAPQLGALADGVKALEERLVKLSSATGGSGEVLEALGKKVAELRMVLVNLNEVLIDSTGGFKDSMLAISEEIDGRLTQKLAAIEERTRQLDEVPHIEFGTKA
jgi:uncharacterized phage infection (PIP) family protein YhgE